MPLAHAIEPVYIESRPVSLNKTQCVSWERERTDEWKNEQTNEPTNDNGHKTNSTNNDEGRKFDKFMSILFFLGLVSTQQTMIDPAKFSRSFVRVVRALLVCMLTWCLIFVLDILCWRCCANIIHIELEMFYFSSILKYSIFMSLIRHIIKW